MASEISASFTVTATKGYKSFSRSASYTADWATARESTNVQNIATAAAGTALVIAAGVTTFGVAWFRNLDSTNYVEVGVQVAGTFYPFVKLKAGEAFPVRLAAGITPYARANTAAVDLEHAVLND